MEVEDLKKSRTPRIILGVIIAVFVVGFIVYLIIGGISASALTKIDDEGHEQFSKTPSDYGIEYEEVRFPAREDQLKVAGWYLSNPDSDRAMILIHGRDASKQNAISGEIVKLASEIHDAGNNVLMIDLRGHGESEDVERYFFGLYERRDVLGAIDWLLEQGIAPGRIGLLGISMGGGATIGAAAEEPAVGLLVVESTFADLGPLVDEKFVEESGLPSFFIPSVLFMNQVLYGYDIVAIKPIEEITALPPRPLYIIHCEQDDTVSMWHPQQLKNTIPEAETWYVDDCEHAEIYRDYPDEYRERLIKFIDANWNE